MDKRNKLAGKYNYELTKVGNNCKRFRTFVLRISQCKLAKELCVSQSSLSLFEKGKVDSAVYLIEYIKRGFNIDVDY